MAIGLGVTTLVLGVEPESLTFLLDFTTTDDKKVGLVTEAVNNRTLKFVFANWDSALATSFSEPIQVGILNQRKIYCLAFVQKAGGTSQQRLVTISFYSGEEVKDG